MLGTVPRSTLALSLRPKNRVLQSSEPMGLCSKWLALLRIMVSFVTLKFKSQRVVRSCKYLSAGKQQDRKYLLLKVDYGNIFVSVKKKCFCLYCVNETRSKHISRMQIVVNLRQHFGNTLPCLIILPDASLPFCGNSIKHQIVTD